MKRSPHHRPTQRSVSVAAPVQHETSHSVTLEPVRLGGGRTGAGRAGRKPRSNGQLETAIAGTMVRRQMDRIPLWRDDHVAGAPIGSKILPPTAICLVWLHRAFRRAASPARAAPRSRGRATVLPLPTAMAALKRSGIWGCGRASMWGFPRPTKAGVGHAGDSRAADRARAQAASGPGDGRGREDGWR